MDMTISGSGQIAAGEYDRVKTSGSGRLDGFVRCSSFHSSGSVSGEEIECKNEFVTSGSSRFSKAVRAESLTTSGSFACGGDIIVKKGMNCSGGMEGNGSVKCGTFTASGGLSVKGDIEAETVKIDGRVKCGGLLNAEEITIKFKHDSKIKNIGGSKIVVYGHSQLEKRVRLPLLSSLMKKGGGDSLCVEESIEGDSVALEGVTAQRVSGRVVAIGDGCEIELVQYSETLEVSPDAKVSRTEKV